MASFCASTYLSDGKKPGMQNWIWRLASLDYGIWVRWYLLIMKSGFNYLLFYRINNLFKTIIVYFVYLFVSKWKKKSKYFGNAGTALRSAVESKNSCLKGFKKKILSFFFNVRPQLPGDQWGCCSKSVKSSYAVTVIFPLSLLPYFSDIDFGTKWTEDHFIISENKKEYWFIFRKSTISSYG